jgi:hypothetical protein
MSVPHLCVFQEEHAPAKPPAWAILLSSPGNVAAEGLFAPLLERWGKLVKIGRPEFELSAAVENERLAGFEPIHVSFWPLQNLRLAPSASNIIAPTWEYPDVSYDAFDGHPENHWLETANRCSLVLAGGPFMANALDAVGVKAPIRVVPAPMPESCFQLPRWRGGEHVPLGCPALVVPHSTPVEHGFLLWRNAPIYPSRRQGLKLDGVVYTSILDPNDERKYKHWEDSIAAFIHALRDCEDATLALKLAACNHRAVDRVVSAYRRLDATHRCRLVLIPDSIGDVEMAELVRATTYYLTTARAEGTCLPLMNFLAAGRPCLSPLHTALADYVDSAVGFVVESHADPSAWPQEPGLRWRPTWHRADFSSLVAQFRRSYEIAKKDPAAYGAMADAAQDRMRQWTHPDAVWPRLQSALDLVASLSSPAGVHPASPRRTFSRAA